MCYKSTHSFLKRKVWLWAQVLEQNGVICSPICVMTYVYIFCWVIHGLFNPLDDRWHIVLCLSSCLFVCMSVYKSVTLSGILLNTGYTACIWCWYSLSQRLSKYIKLDPANRDDIVKDMMIHKCSLFILPWLFVTALIKILWLIVWRNVTNVFFF